MNFGSHANVSGSPTPLTWYVALPPFTRTIVTAIFMSTIGTSLGLISKTMFILNYDEIIHRMQLWRLLLPFFYFGGFGISFLIFLFLYAQYSTRIETELRDSCSPGSYMYFNTVLWAILITIDILITWLTDGAFHQYFMSKPYYYAVIYYWSKREPWATVTFWFGFILKGSQLPFAMLLFDVLTGDSWLSGFVGLVGGHCIYFVRDVMPGQGYGDIFYRTPAIFDNASLWLDSVLDGNQGGISNGQHNRTNAATGGDRNTTSQSGQFAGRGYRLGSDM